MTQLIESISPATGEKIGTSELNTVEDLNKQIVCAREAQIEWTAVTGS